MGGPSGVLGRVSDIRSLNGHRQTQSPAYYTCVVVNEVRLTPAWRCVASGCMLPVPEHLGFCGGCLRLGPLRSGHGCLAVQGRGMIVLKSVV
jgi:hypothetical protein